MKIYDKAAEELYELWDLQTGDKSDILSALKEAFLGGAAAGSMDSDLAKEAISYDFKLEKS